MRLALKKIPYAYLLLTLIGSLACNNYDLKDKLENPGATTYSDRLHVFVSSISTIGNMSALQTNGCTGS